MQAWFSPEDKLIETLLKQAVAQHFHGYLDPCDHGSAYDCTLLIPHTVEMKYDRKAALTGNLYFEIRNTRQRQPSGLAATTADFWAHYIPEPWQSIALYPPTTMLHFLSEQLDNHRQGYRLSPPHGGDQNSQGILAPIQDILSQVFVQRIAFRILIPNGMSYSGIVGRCHHCHRTLAIELLRMGICQECHDKPCVVER